MVGRSSLERPGKMSSQTEAGVATEAAAGAGAAATTTSAVAAALAAAANSGNC